MPQLSLLSIVILGVLFAVVRYVNKSRQRSLKHIRGPSSSSWLVGNEYDLVHQIEVGKLETPWFREYGTLLRYSGCYGEDVLLIADALALQHIFHASSYHYPKSNDVRSNSRRLFGRGLVSAEGETHARHRKALNPAFSASQLKSFLSLFQQETQKVRPLHGTTAKDNGDMPTVDVAKWISRLTLDIIGRSSFDYDFQAVEEAESKLAKALKDFFPIVLTKMDKLQNDWLEASNKAALQILDKRANSDSGEKDADSKDILSILVRSNNLSDPKKRLDDDEVLAQMSTMILAGHETTGSTSIWLFYELAKRPEYQERIWNEIEEVRRKKEERGENREENFTPNEYDSMPFFNAIIKEVLRFHPIAISLFRNPDRDDVIPLQEPIMSLTGEKLTEVPVKKGQRIHIHIPTYNRLKCVWGEDAEKFNPERFLLDEKRGTMLGMYANLMTFSAGVRGCIGWRFALLELQAILEGLVSNFEFSVDPSLEVIRAQAGAMQPLLRGKEKEGFQMPLRIKKRARVQA
ncbi:PAH-inducible cytochrome P450 monooxygenase PC-PAH 1 [Dendrothele bispora CBS 962.96]|uniref:PAH-inducible cytochrome P450 monooxygenase PC-PAH 1 n=1 Tax=Dendrothele bispora (strain CBS 962.96) TaxID=1314807 RepID=A0A4S8MUZ8_DENBC|nr:PAH-inducible cytochrome P450 monooxygenase PC-PAH 1 [Dendrothele bispora CBS 962.96]